MISINIEQKLAEIRVDREGIYDFFTNTQFSVIKNEELSYYSQLQMSSSEHDVTEYGLQY